MTGVVAGGPASRVLVTGADGYMGSHLVDELVSRGSSVVAVVRRTSRAQVTRRFNNLSPSTVDRLADVVAIDLAGPAAVEQLRRTEADVWFHLAADAYVPASLDLPAEVVETNVRSTSNVLEAARLSTPAHLLVASSSEVYGAYDRAIVEDDVFWPATPYAASKVACDRLAWSYHSTFDLPVTIVRPFNSYGPRHVYDVIPKFVVAALRGETLRVHGDGRQTRDFTFVSDTVAALLALADVPPSGEAFNVGTGTDHEVLALAHQIVELCSSASRIELGPPRPGDVRRLLADRSKLTAATGWQPEVGFEDGLRRTVDWAAANLDAL